MFNEADLQALRSAVRERRLIVIAGAGVSCGAGLPLWRDLLCERMPAFLRARGLEGQKVADTLLANATAGFFLQAADVWWTWTEQHGGLPAIEQFLRETFLQADKPTPTHERIVELCDLAGPGIITTNYDRLFEIQGRKLLPRTQADPNLGLLFAPGAQKFVLKLHGTAQNVETVVLTSKQYGQQSLRQAYAAVFQATQLCCTLLFVGYGGRDPDLDHLREELAARFNGNIPPVYMLLDRPDAALLEFLQQRGVIVGEFNGERDGYGVIDGLLDQLLVEARLLPPVITEAREPGASIDQQRVRDLLEAMGYRVQAEQELSASRAVWLCQGKFGTDVRCDLAVFVPGEVTKADIEWVRQQVRSNSDLSRGVVLTTAGADSAIVGAARAAGCVDFFTLEEYEARLADFRDYALRLKQDYEQSDIPAYYVDLRCRREQGPVGAAMDGRLDAFFADWLAQPGRHHASLRGDFGAGKSWFCRRLAYRHACRYLANPARERAPVLISLRDYAKAYDIQQAITDALVNQFGVTLSGGYRTFRYLNEHGKILLLFDGFDEMERRVADYRTTRENFEELAKVVTPQSKVLLTCRTAYFRHRQEEREVLEPHLRARVLDREQVIDLESREGFEVVHLQLFDDSELEEALRKRLPDSWQAAFDKVKKIHDLPNLAQRPVLLEMITRTLDRLGPNDRVNQATLYEDYTSQLIQRRSAPGQSLTPEQRRDFVEELAWDMNHRQRLTLRFDEFPAQVKARFHLEDKPEAAAFLERDIRTQTYVRDDEGNYSFGHQSFMEFFVARRLYALLKKGEGVGCPVNEAIRSFVAALAELEAYEYERQPAPEGMVYVPPGPFFCGEGPDLRIAQMERGVCIDMKPVSVGDYLEFVAWVKKTGRRAHAHCHPDEPKRKNHHPDAPARNIPPDYFTDARYHDFPVVLIDWYDAYAFAAWKGKRLPTDEEWEKAARGPFGRVYPWGDTFDRALANSAEFWTGRELPDFDTWEKWWQSPKARKAMATKPGDFGGQSLFGCVDMAGNVWEWTASLYEKGKNSRTVRGGAFDDHPDLLRAALRDRNPPCYRGRIIGFRCAQDP